MAISLDANNIKGIIGKASSLFHLNKYIEALSVIEDALKIESNNTLALKLKLDILNKI